MPIEIDLSGKTALVTGASRGIGEARITERTGDGIVGECDIKVGDTLVTRVPNIELRIAPNMRVAERIIRLERAARS